MLFDILSQFLFKWINANFLTRKFKNLLNKLLVFWLQRWLRSTMEIAEFSAVRWQISSEGEDKPKLQFQYRKVQPKDCVDFLIFDFPLKVAGETSSSNKIRTTCQKIYLCYSHLLLSTLRPSDHPQHIAAFYNSTEGMLVIPWIVKVPKFRYINGFFGRKLMGDMW